MQHGALASSHSQGSLLTLFSLPVSFRVAIAQVSDATAKGKDIVRMIGWVVHRQDDQRLRGKRKLSLTCLSRRQDRDQLVHPPNRKSMRKRGIKGRYGQGYRWWLCSGSAVFSLHEKLFWCWQFWYRPGTRLNYHHNSRKNIVGIA